MPLIKEFTLGPWRLEMHHEDDIELGGIVPGDDNFYNQCFLVRLYRGTHRSFFSGSSVVPNETRCDHMFDCIKESLLAHFNDDSFEPDVDPAW